MMYLLLCTLLLIGASPTIGQEVLCPKQANTQEVCSVLGKECRYDPIGCKDGIQFATVCKCSPLLCGDPRYVCETTEIVCEGNDPDCPATPGFGQTCDPSIVDECNYDPYDGCPGSTIPPFYQRECFCDPSSKTFVCSSTGVTVCSEGTPSPTPALRTKKKTKKPSKKPAKKPTAKKPTAKK